MTTRQERKAAKAELRRQVEDRLARVDTELGSRLDDWDRPAPADTLKRGRS